MFDLNPQLRADATLIWAETARVAAALAGSIHRHCIIPLMVNPDRPELFGTGFFVRSAKALYLVSASHVLSIREVSGRAPTFNPGMYFTVGYRRIRWLNGAPGYLKPDGFEDDIDVSVSRFESAIGWSDGAAKAPLDLGALRLNGYVIDNGYFFVGFPATRFERDSRTHQFNANSAVWVADESQSDVRAKVGALPWHIVLDYDHKGSRGAPAMDGMSGAPVWGLTHDGSGVPQVEALGVFIEHRKKERVLICVRMSFVVDLIDQYELKEPPNPECLTREEVDGPWPTRPTTRARSPRPTSQPQ